MSVGSTKMAFFSQCLKQKKQTATVCGRLCRDPPLLHPRPLTPPSPPPVLFLFWVFDFNNLCPAAACKGKLCDTPHHLLSVGCSSSWQRRAGAVKWPFHFGGEAHPLPARFPPSFCSLPLASSPTLDVQKAFHFGPHCVGGPTELPSPLGTERLTSGPIATWQRTRVMSSDGTRRCVPVPVCIF